MFDSIPRRRLRPIHPLHRILVLNGVTVTDAAMALGCSRAFLSAAIHGKRRPGPKLAARMGELERALREGVVGAEDDRA